MTLYLLWCKKKKSPKIFLFTFCSVSLLQAACFYIRCRRHCPIQCEIHQKSCRTACFPAPFSSLECSATLIYDQITVDCPGEKREGLETKPSCRSSYGFHSERKRAASNVYDTCKQHKKKWAKCFNKHLCEKYLHHNKYNAIVEKNALKGLYHL